MEELLSWINYCRQHPDGYYVCGCDYGYGDDHTEAQSLNADKILELWKVNSKWREMVTDFRQFLIIRYAEHDDDDKPIEGTLPDDDQEYSIEITITIKPEYSEYFKKKGYYFDIDDRYSITFTIANTDDTIMNNIVNILAIEEHILNSPPHYFRYLAIDEHEFYYSSFNTEEELNTKIVDALDDDET